jgi:hypothetical protein
MDSKALSMLTRRGLLRAAGAASLVGLAACAAPAALRQPSPASPDVIDPGLLDDLERRTFDFFWDTSDPRTGLAPDRWPSESFASIAAVGFALTAYPIGVERGWITREQACERVWNTLKFFSSLPQGPQAKGVAGHKGFFYHFLDMKSGLRFERCELSTVDTALLLAGALFCRDWFDGDAVQETEIRRLANALYARVDWTWAQTRGPSISHGWSPEGGFISSDWKGYNEAMLVYLLALGSPTYPVDEDAWVAWISTYDRDSWGSEYGQTYLRFPPLFGHQFTHCWVDFRGIQDAYMRGRGLDYFENSRRASYAQRSYAMVNPEGWAGYGKDVWGITASDGPADVSRVYGGRERQFISYAGRGMGGAHNHDDGTLAPYGAGASIVFAPEIVIPALLTMHERYGKHIYGRYGFFDAFNLSFHYEDVKLQHGRLVPGFGWVDTDYIGIDQGPLLAMLGNHRGEIIWKTTRRSDWLVRGLKRAGFTGGWLK